MEQVTIDCETGTMNAVPMTDDEIASWQAASDEMAAIEQAATDAALQRQADLATIKLGTTAPGYADALGRLLGSG